MAAYVISEVDVRDPAGFETYRSMAAPTIARYGDRYLVRGGQAALAEGGPVPKTIILVEFPSIERLREIVRIAGICRSVESASDDAGSPSDLCRGRGAGLIVTSPRGRSCRARCRIPAAHGRA